MAPETPAASFDDIIQADRRKRKAQKLADQILGKRRSSAPGHGALSGRKTALGPSLSSRIGIHKRSGITPRSVSLTKKKVEGAQLFQGASTRTLSSKTTSFRAPLSRQTGSLSNSHQRQQNTSNIEAQSENTSNEITIKGIAGPYAVIASNFAPGTTAADIEAVMAPVGGSMVSCRLVSAHPTVIAELLFQDKGGAENVIAMFNNKKADGRLLYVYLKGGPPHDFSRSPSVLDPHSKNNDTNYYAEDRSSRKNRDQNLMEVDREDRHLSSYQIRNTRGVDYQDGRYGFGESTGPVTRKADRGGREQSRMVSDGLLRRTNNSSNY